MGVPAKKVATALNYLAIIGGTLLLVLSVLKNVTNLEENECEMTYMFEYPEYIPIDLDNDLQTTYPKYSLMMYGEGQYANSLRYSGPSGIPVLFIPGNAGSHKQVRSLGSIALRKTENLGFSFNYFTVDFKEELTALSGHYLERQTKFVHECIKIILEMYKFSKPERKSLILIGHSMGGVIARGLFTLSSFDVSTVSTVITLASPNRRPTFMVDQEMLRYYDKITDFWNTRKHAEKRSTDHLVLASIGGGNRDIQVKSNLIPLETSLENQTLSVITSSIPKVWLSTDHRCIVWCKQLILAITRALVDMVDRDSLTLRHNSKERLEILRYHLVSSFSSENSLMRANALVPSSHTMDLSSCKLLKNKLDFKSSPKLQRSCFMLELADDIVEVNAMYSGNLVDWIGACRSQTTCKSYSSLATKGEIIPSIGGNVKVISIKRDEIPRKYKVLLFKLSDPTKERLFIKMKCKENGTLSIRKSLSDRRLLNQRTFLRLELPIMQVPWISHRMLINSSCKDNHPSISATLRIPWLNEGLNKVTEEVLDLPLSFNIIPSEASHSRLSSFINLFENHEQNQSQSKIASQDDVPEVLLWFNSKCNFTVHTSLDIAGTLGQLLRFSYNHILPWTAVFSLRKLVDETCPFETKSGQFVGNLLLLIVRSDLNPMFFNLHGLVLVAFEILTAHGTFSMLVIFTNVLIRPVQNCGRNIYRTVSISRCSGPPEKPSQRRSKTLFYVEIIILICLSLHTSSSIALLAQVVIFVAKAVTSHAKTNPKALYISIVQIVLQLPRLVIWIKELEGESRLKAPDVASMTCIVFIIAAHVNNYCEDRKTNVLYSKVMYTFAMLLILPLMELCWISQLTSIAYIVHCLLSKKQFIKSQT